MLRISEDIHHGAFLDDVAIFDNSHTVADGFNNLHLVGNEHDGQIELFIDILKQLQNGFGGLRVQRRGGLVAEQHLGVAGQRAGNADTLFLTTGKLAGIVISTLF